MEKRQYLKKTLYKIDKRQQAEWISIQQIKRDSCLDTHQNDFEICQKVQAELQVDYNETNSWLLSSSKGNQRERTKILKVPTTNKCWKELCAPQNIFEEKLLIETLQISKINTLPKPTSIKGTYKVPASIYQNEGKSPHMENLRSNDVMVSKIKMKIFVRSKKSL